MTIYRPTYISSHALVIGINNYKHAAPLQFAVNDANAVEQVLVDKFNFLQSNIVCLLDDAASREAIMEAYLALARQATEPDDRVLIYYAGHGQTIKGERGEVGYLVPHDGADERLTSLIRWDELTRNAELIRAKHVFFIMDACYGGLALRRGLQPGSSRLLKDMLCRPVRQVLTAGKADEQVSDAGGPLADHSVFTGHLLQGLDGRASMAGGIITANGLMAYVYQQVGTDHDSQQTPHYGFLDGDGDFVFSQMPLANEAQTKGDDDVFIEVPAVVVPSPSSTEEVITQVKELIPVPSKGIVLDNLLVGETRKVIGLFADSQYSASDTEITVEAVAQRLSAYEEGTRSLRGAFTAIGHWGDASHGPLAKKLMVRLVESVPNKRDNELWPSLMYYPSILAFYCFGIGAIANGRYELLYGVMQAKVGAIQTRQFRPLIAVAMGDASLELQRSDPFKLLPEHVKHYVPRSEYLFKLLQPELDDLMFLGKSYENIFDKFEILWALTFLDLSGRSWVPLGRFGWKWGDYPSDPNPFKELIEDSSSQGDDWPPIRAGFFGGSVARLDKAIATLKAFLSSHNWF